MKLRCLKVIVAMLAALMPLAPRALAEQLYPRHINAKTETTVNRGLEYLAKTQSPDGNWPDSRDAQAYPVTMASLAGMAFLANGNTPSRGKYADQVRKAVEYVMSNAQTSGLIANAGADQGQPMYGHGFGMLFLASVYGMENDDKVRSKLKKVIVAAIDLTARAQSNYGGWTYSPGGGDEGSVTVTQIQGLRAAKNAGFTVPKGTIEEAVKYLERCRTPDGGIRYAYISDPTTRLAISAAAIATLYNAGEYDSQLADGCLAYVWKQFSLLKGEWSKRAGHDYYTHLYAAQAFYQAGDKYWDEYFPATRDQLIGMQQGDGSYQGEVGPVYGTSIAMIILQLPYKFLPIYQR